MSNPNYTQLAQFALAVMDKATIQADDATLNATAMSRNMLHAIVSGELIVYPKPVAAPRQTHMATEGIADARGGMIVPAGGTAPPMFEGED